MTIPDYDKDCQRTPPRETVGEALRREYPHVRLTLPEANAHSEELARELDSYKSEADALRKDNVRLRMADHDKTHEELRDTNDLLRALLWATANDHYGRFPTLWNHRDGIWRLRYSTADETAKIDLGPACDICLIPAPVAARLVADWREATR